MTTSELNEWQRMDPKYLIEPFSKQEAGTFLCQQFTSCGHNNKCRFGAILKVVLFLWNIFFSTAT